MMGRGTWASLALFMLGIAVVAGFYFEQTTRITSVEFAGQTYTPLEELEDAMLSPIGLLADSVDYEEIYRSVSDLPYVKDVAVRMSYRGKLTIDVEERKPIGLLAGPRTVYFDEAGIQLPPIPGKLVDVPIVYGFQETAPGDTISGDGFDQVLEFMKQATNDSFSWATLSEVAWSNREGVVALSNENGVKLLFGRDRFEQKIEHWKAFYQRVVSHRGIDSFRSIDLRFRNQIVTDEL